MNRLFYRDMIDYILYRAKIQEGHLQGIVLFCGRLAGVFRRRNGD